jgi:type VI secretion system protein ImpL
MADDRTRVPGTAGGAVANLATDATRLPAPLDALMAGVASGALGQSSSRTHAQLNEQWQSQVLPLCQQALENRYPMVRGSQIDVTLDDFAKLFAPNGLIDGFFKTNLKPFVDTSRTPWAWQKVDNVELGISPDVLVQFQRAAAIRDGFFAAGGGPAVKFEMVPVSLDANATQVLIDINGQELSYAHGPTRPTLVQWPGSPGSEGGRVAFSPAAADSPATITKQGPWSLFRLFDEARIQRSGSGLSDKLQVTFTVGGRTAVYEIQANSVRNPFLMPELHEFRCPARL